MKAESRLQQLRAEIATIGQDLIRLGGKRAELEDELRLVEAIIEAMQKHRAVLQSAFEELQGGHLV